MPERIQRPREPSRQPARVARILAAAVDRNGRVLPTWPERGTGRTAKLATCGHCGGKPLIIRVCGKDSYQRVRHCAVCEVCGAHRRVEPVGRPVSPAVPEQAEHFPADEGPPPRAPRKR